MNPAPSDSTLKNFRIIGTIEGISALVLFFVAMPLKYFWDMPLAVKYVGWAHGILFMLYLAAVAVTAYKYRWRLLMIAAAVIASVIPFGPFVFDAKFLKPKPVVK